MLRRLSFAVVLAALLALLLSVTLAQGRPAGRGAHPAKVERFRLTFIALTRNDHPVAVKRVRYRHLPLICKQGGVRVHGHLPRMRVRHRRFGDRFVGHHHVIKVSGRFRNHKQVAKGTFRFTGKFSDGGKRYTNCDSGKRRWAVGRS